MMLRYQGKILNLVQMVDLWIMRNADELFKDPSVRENLLSLELSDPKRTARMREYLNVEDKPEGKRRELFELALKDYALGELLYPKFRNIIYRQKMTISSCVHPTNDYHYRQQFIERNINAIIAYYNYGERRIIDGDLDV